MLHWLRFELSAALPGGSQPFKTVALTFQVLSTAIQPRELLVKMISASYQLCLEHIGYPIQYFYKSQSAVYQCYVIDAITIPIAFSKWLIIISSKLFSLFRLPLRCFEPLSAPSPMLKACCYVPGYPKVWLHRFYQANHSIILLTIPRKAQPQYIITVPIIITINTKKFFKCSIIVSSKLFSLFHVPHN